MRLFHTTVKMTLVGVIATLLARLFRLDFYMTAGVIAILSIHLTKRDSLIYSLRRFIDALFALVIATLMFIGFGYSFFVYALFIFLFCYASFVLKIAEGIVLSVVLVTHLYLEQTFSSALLINEIYLLLVSIGVATIFNILYPTSSEKELNKHVESIDQLIRDHLFMLSLLLKDPAYNEEYYRHYIAIDKKIQRTIDIVELVDKDMLFQNDHSYLAYLHMRKEQNSYIRHMYQQALKIKRLHPYAREISAFIVELTYDIGVYNKAFIQLKNLDLIQQRYKDATLPETREEFEIRAILYQILNEVESLLMVKVSFHHSYPEFGLKHAN
ncbi:MAG: aromatic acid exporter family protein [Bacillota bacterium]|nr:MAG: aromatic acid exporter family protein [Bacillota bacterium]